MSIRRAEGTVNIRTTFTLTNTLQGRQQKSSTTPIGGGQVNRTIGAGVQENQANRAWELLEQELVSGSDMHINLATFAGVDIGAGEGNDGLGLPMDLEEVVLIQIEHIEGEGVLEVRPSTASGWTPIGCPAGSCRWPDLKLSLIHI